MMTTTTTTTIGKLGTEFAQLAKEVESALSLVFIAEDEIDAAGKRHPGSEALLHHAFRLLMPDKDLLRTEFVFRSHCAELLDRVAAGADTTRPTAAEVAVACCELSQRIPLPTGAVTVYMRAWREAFADTPMFDDDLEHYEHVSAARADQIESMLRGKLVNCDRVLENITCEGLHHGEPVDCPFAAQPAGKQAV